MARHTTLNELVEQLRAECRLSTATSRGLDDRAHLEQLIRRNYAMLYDDYSWPFLTISKEASGKLTQAGQRYYDFPAALNFDRPFTVWHHYGSVWHKLEHGITPQDYIARDSDANDRSAPILKWDNYADGQFEIWPMPANNGEEIRFEGVQAMTALVDETSRADLDDHLIVLTCAAEVLAGNNQKDAQIKADLAERRRIRLMGNHSSGKRITMGGGEDEIPGRVKNLRVAYTVR